jgi:hypothetical protein
MVPTELQSLPTGKVTKLGSTTFLDLQKLLSKRSSAQQESQTAAPPLEAVAIAPTAHPCDQAAPRKELLWACAQTEPVLNTSQEAQIEL